MDNVPATLREAVVFFEDANNCFEFMKRLRWPDGKVLCPRCGSDNVDYLPNARVFKCFEKHEKQKFSLKVGTIFEDSPISLSKWLPVMWLIVNCKNGISSWEIHRAIGVTQKTAWFMLQRARLAMQDQVTGGKMGSPDGGPVVEMDETWIGGKVRNMHKKRKARMKAQKDYGKTIVHGILERGGKIRAKVVPDVQFMSLIDQIRDNIAQGAQLHTDQTVSYIGLSSEYEHEVINHLEAYVRDNVHTNGMENFWSLLKRGLSGTYVSVEPFHLFRYVDEQAFRYNHRKGMDDSDRFVSVMSQIVGKRLTYADLTGKVGETQSDQTPEARA